MQIARTISELRVLRPQLGANVGLVPTMGGLHEGHLAIVRAAHEENEAVLTTVFLNPTQFSETNDLAAYPRDLEKDLAILREEGVNLVFAPAASEIYPHGFQTEINVPTLSSEWEGSARPGHFRAVATIVTILLNLAAAPRAYFGQKDAQQVVVIRRLVRDLRIATEIAVIPTVRAADGLAFSTRNERLSADERTSATGIFRAFGATSASYDAGERATDSLRQTMWDSLTRDPSLRIDYAEIVDAGNLRPIRSLIASDYSLLAIAAVRIGDVRLIDNMVLPAIRNNRADLSALLGVAW